MKFIRPTKVTDAMLISSTIPETDYENWLASTSYVIGDRVTRAVSGVHRNFENLIAGVDATFPEISALNLTPRWLDIGPTNKWAMFDGLVGTQSSAPTSITVVLAPGRLNSLALLQVDATNIDIMLTVSGSPVYEASMDMTSGNAVGDWYQYFYEPVYQQDAVTVINLFDSSLLDIPAYSEGILTITLSKTSGTVSIGAMVFGLYADLGETEYKPTLGIIDYSRKEVDQFGNYTIIKRAYSKRMNAQVMVMQADVDNVTRILSQYRSTPVVWIGAGNLFTGMIIYGFYKEWEMLVDNFRFADLSISIEGLT
jgi:hypothetical protein